MLLYHPKSFCLFQVAMCFYFWNPFLPHSCMLLLIVSHLVSDYKILQSYLQPVTLHYIAALTINYLFSSSIRQEVQVRKLSSQMSNSLASSKVSFQPRSPVQRIRVNSFFLSGLCKILHLFNNTRYMESSVNSHSTDKSFGLIP